MSIWLGKLQKNEVNLSIAIKDPTSIAVPFILLRL